MMGKSKCEANCPWRDGFWKDEKFRRLDVFLTREGLQHLYIVGTPGEIATFKSSVCWQYYNIEFVDGGGLKINGIASSFINVGKYLRLENKPPLMDTIFLGEMTKILIGDKFEKLEYKEII